MKPILLFLLLIALLSIDDLYSQGEDGKPTCNTQACNIDFRSPLPGVLSDDDVAVYKGTSNNGVPYGKSATLTTGYSDVNYSALPENCDDGTPSNAATCSNTTDQLFYYVYYPNNYNYATCRLPAMIIVHGGGFQDCGARLTSPFVVRLCYEFAKRGFVVFNVEYRTGALPQTFPTSSIVYSAQQLLAIYRAGQDIRGAIRSIIQRERDGTEPYRIDTSKMFAGGGSAGSLSVMNAVYYTQSMIDDVLPGISSPNILGPISQDYYYGTPSVPYTVRGCLNMWGAMPIPVNKLSDIKSFFTGNKPPIISFHGQLDPTFNPDKQDFIFSSKVTPPPNYKSEKRCLLVNNPNNAYTLAPSSTGNDGYLLGSQKIYETFTGAGVASELYLDCNMHHGVDDAGTVPYTSNFGVSTDTNFSQTAEYIASRAAVFFQAVLNGKAKLLVTTKFVDCENIRYGCATTATPNGNILLDKNNGCSNTDVCPQ